jgi:glycosyltransferase involved in cell wall biosynthesis
MLLAVASFAHGLGKPYVIIPNGMLDPYSLTRSGLKKKIALATLGYRRMLAAFLHVGPEESKLLEPRGLRATKRIFPNGIFFQEIEPLPEKGGFRRLHPQLGNKPFVLFLSRLHHKKGLDYLADAFADSGVLGRSRATRGGRTGWRRGSTVSRPGPTGGDE